MSRLSRSSPAVWLLAALVTLPQIGETIYTPALTDLARDLAISQGQAQSTLSIFFIAFAIGVLSWGRLCDRWGRRPTLLLALGTPAEVAAWVNYICPVAGARVAMEKIDPDLAESPFIFPSEDYIADHDIVGFRDQWEARSERFGQVQGYVGSTQHLPAPPLPPS